MVDGVQSQKIAEKLVQEATKDTGGVAEAKTPDAADVNRFEELMQKDDAGVNAVQQESSKISGADKTTAENVSPGDKILESLEKQRANFNERVQDLNRSLESMTRSGHFSPAELLKVQWQLQQATLEVEMTTKVVDKTDQGVGTLLRNQG